MEMVAILLLIGVAVYFFFKHSTTRGTNTVRAYLYLRAVNAGLSIADANDYARDDVVNGPTQTIVDAKEFVRTMYGGKQLPMIAEAKRLGLVL